MSGILLFSSEEWDDIATHFYWSNWDTEATNSTWLHAICQSRGTFTSQTQTPWGIMLGDLHRRRAQFLLEQLESQDLISLERDLEDVLPGQFTAFIDGGSKPKGWKVGDPFGGSFAWSWAARAGGFIAEGLGAMVPPGRVPHNGGGDPIANASKYF